MKRLILVRHSKTEALSGIGSDFERALKKRGYKDAKLVAKYLKKAGHTPDLILSSPAVRAKQTAQRFAAVFGISEKKLVYEQLLYDGDTTAVMLDIIAQCAKDVETVMVVGHNPDIARLSSRLVDNDYLVYPTTATHVISFNVSHWDAVSVSEGRSELFVYPKMLKLDKEG